MNDVIIKVCSKTGIAEKYIDTLGNQNQNLQNKLKFKFKDEIIEGIAWLEYETDNEKKYALMERYDEGYQIDIKSCLLVSHSVKLDIKITQDETPSGVPIFVSNPVIFKVIKTINAREKEPDEYPSWFESANKLINDADNLDLDVSKNGNVSTITVTKKDGTQKSVEVYDGTGEGTGTGIVANVNFDIVDGYLQLEYSEDTNVEFSINENGELEVIM